MRSSRSRLVLAASLSLASCATAPPTPVAAVPPPTPIASAASPSPTAPPAFPSREARIALFRHLVAEIARIHVPTPHLDTALGFDLAAEQAILEHEMADATDKRAVRNVLRQLGTSLHNAHCQFQDGPWLKGASLPLDAGFTLETDVSASLPRFFVDEVHAKELGGRLATGDVLESVDGISLARRPVEELAWLSEWNNSDGVADDIASALPRRGIKRSLPNPGETSTWHFRRAKTGEPFEIAIPWKPVDTTAEETGNNNDHAVAYDGNRCAHLSPTAYGSSYALTAVGQGFCLYTSKAKEARAFPIVRQFSFLYRGSVPSKHLVRADHDHLAAALHALGPIQGLLLDLRENGGGHNPNFFLDWYAPGAYRDHDVRLRLLPELGTGEGLAKVNAISGLEGVDEQYPKWLAAAKPGDAFGPYRPFFCSDKGCDWDNAYVPKHRVTDAKIALIVGPHCVSSCDSFAEVFDTYDLGPLVGLEPALAFTTVRYPLDVKLDGQLLGTLTLAMSEEKNGKGDPVEGVPRHLAARVPRTAENAATYDAVLVDEAKKALTAWSKRKRG